MTDYEEKAEFDDVVCEQSTDKAILCVFEDGTKHWIPNSQVDDDSEVYEHGHEGKLVVSLWIAEQKGLV